MAWPCLSRRGQRACRHTPSRDTPPAEASSGAAPGSPVDPRRSGCEAQQAPYPLVAALCIRLRCQYQYFQPSSCLLFSPENKGSPAERSRHSSSRNARPRRSYCLCLVVPPLALRPDQLCLPTDTDQGRRASLLERGDHGTRLLEWHIQPGLAPHTMQLHIHHLFAAGALLACHGTSCLLGGSDPSLLTFAPSSYVR